MAPSPSPAPTLCFSGRCHKEAIDPQFGTGGMGACSRAVVPGCTQGDVPGSANRRDPCSSHQAGTLQSTPLHDPTRDPRDMCPRHGSTPRTLTPAPAQQRCTGSDMAAGKRQGSEHYPRRQPGPPLFPAHKEA